MTLYKNADPQWVKQRRHFCVAPFLEATRGLDQRHFLGFLLRDHHVDGGYACEVSLVGIRLPATSYGLQLFKSKTSSIELPYLVLFLDVIFLCFALYCKLVTPVSIGDVIWT